MGPPGATIRFSDPRTFAAAQEEAAALEEYLRGCFGRRGQACNGCAMGGYKIGRLLHLAFERGLGYEASGGGKDK